MVEKHVLNYKCIFNGEDFNHVEGPFITTFNGMSKEFLSYILNNPEMVEMISEGYWDIEIKISPNLGLERESSGRKEEQS